MPVRGALSAASAAAGAASKSSSNAAVYWYHRFIPSDAGAYTIYALMGVMLLIGLSINLYLCCAFGGTRKRSTGAMKMKKDKKEEKKKKEKEAAAKRKAGKEVTVEDEDEEDEEEGRTAAVKATSATSASSTSSDTNGSLVRIVRSTDSSSSSTRKLVATRTLPLEHCILLETPLLIIPSSFSPSSLQSAFDTLTTEAQDQIWTFDDLHAKQGSGGGKTLEGIVKSRGIVLENGVAGCYDLAIVQAAAAGSTEEGSSTSSPSSSTSPHSSPSIALSSYISRISHSCSPNLSITYNSRTNTLRAVTTREVKEGEELTRSFLPLIATMDYDTRRRKLKDVYGIESTCAVDLAHAAVDEVTGASRNEARQVSDTNRLRIGALITELRPSQSSSSASSSSDPTSVIRTAERIFSLLTLESLEHSMDALRILCDVSKLLCDVKGFEVQAEEYCKRAYDAALRLCGDGSVTTVELKKRLACARINLEEAGIREKEA